MKFSNFPRVWLIKWQVRRTWSVPIFQTRSFLALALVEPYPCSSSPNNLTATLIARQAKASTVKLDVFKELNKKEQKSELARVNKKSRKRYATTDNKTHNELVYTQCFKENKNLEASALEPDTLWLILIASQSEKRGEDQQVPTNPDQSRDQLCHIDGEPILRTTVRCLELLEYPGGYMEQREEFEGKAAGNRSRH